MASNTENASILWRHPVVRVLRGRISTHCAVSVLSNGKIRKCIVMFHKLNSALHWLSDYFFNWCSQDDRPLQYFAAWSLVTGIRCFSACFLYLMRLWYDYRKLSERRQIIWSRMSFPVSKETGHFQIARLVSNWYVLCSNGSFGIDDSRACVAVWLTQLMAITVWLSPEHSPSILIRLRARLWLCLYHYSLNGDTPTAKSREVSKPRVLSWWSFNSWNGSDCSHLLQWRHNELGGVSNHQLHDCLLDHLFRRWSKKT